MHPNARIVLSADAVCAGPVKDAEGRRLGSIEAVMLDVERGSVEFAVMSFGGFLGFADRLFAIPWSALHFDSADRSFVLDMDEDRLERAPAFDRNAWPDFSDPSWLRSTRTFWGLSADGDRSPANGSPSTS